MVRAAIPNFNCAHHNLEYSLVDHEFNLLCESCPQSDNAQLLQTYFDKPMIGLIQHYSPAMEVQEELLDRDFQAKMRRNLRQS